jgi:hypothetical protein
MKLLVTGISIIDIHKYIPLKIVYCKKDLVQLLWYYGCLAYFGTNKGCHIVKYKGHVDLNLH